MDTGTHQAWADGLQRVFATMMQLEAQAGGPWAADRGRADDVVGVVDLEGDFAGLVAVRSPRKVAELLVRLFTGLELETDGQDFTDAYGELAGMICGSAAGRMEGKDVRASSPRVMTGAEVEGLVAGGVAPAVMPCRSDCGEMWVEVYAAEAVAVSGKGERGT